ncbi:hypothetical protein C0584_05395 [Candidatus Parcubacteria bacterium]|nr:MAG: hypothetical protein C0584_05395 [Candidatus Parcubacteria bacterium]
MSDYIDDIEESGECNDLIKLLTGAVALLMLSPAFALEMWVGTFTEPIAHIIEKIINLIF